MKTNQKGLSTLEMVAVMVIMAVLGLVLVTNVTKSKRTAEDNNMRAKAVQLNTHMSSFMTDRSIRQSLALWAGKSNDQRYQLLRPYLEFSTPNLDGFMIEGYTITFPDDPRGAVTLRDPEGNVMEYN